MAKKRYKYPMCDYPLYIGTKEEMEKHLKNSSMTDETHKVKKIPWIRGGRNKYGIYRK